MHFCLHRLVASRPYRALILQQRKTEDEVHEGSKQDAQPEQDQRKASKRQLEASPLPTAKRKRGDAEGALQDQAPNSINNNAPAEEVRISCTTYCLYGAALYGHFFVRALPLK